MKPIKFPIYSTLVLFAIAGLLAFSIPLPHTKTASNVISELLQ
jgi:hypothetical protein